VANLPYQRQLINPKFCVSKKTVVSGLLTIIGNYLSYLSGFLCFVYGKVLKKTSKNLI